MKWQSRDAVRDRGYLIWLRSERCIVTGQLGNDHESVVPAHVGTRGKGIKSGDDEVLPLIEHLHSGGHGHGEVSMFREHLPDSILRLALRAYARELYAEYQADLESQMRMQRR